EAVEQARPYFERAAAAARDAGRPGAERATAIRLLGYGPFGVAAPMLQELLAPQNPGEVQLAAVRALAQHYSPQVAELLLTGWGGYSPTVRREVLEAVFARPDRLHVLLNAVEQKKVLAGQLEPARIDLLKKHKDAGVRKRAAKLFAGLVTADRQKV